MLKLIVGEDHKENCGRIYRDLLRRAEDKTSGNILIVPEQYSFSAEWELCRLGGKSISRFAEVLSFSRLAGRVEAIYGGGAIPALDQGGRLLAAACAVDAARSRLKLYASMSQKPEFLSQLLSAFDEFGGYGVLPDDLRKLADGSFSGRFAQKLEELGLLYESYLSVTAQRQDATRRTERLISRLESGEYQKERTFFVFGFADLTALERGVLQELARFAPVEIAIDSTFSAVPEQLRQWERFCAENGIPFTSETVPARKDGVQPEVYALQRLMCGEAAETAPACGAVKTVLYSNEEAMLRGAVRRICELLRAGEPASEIAVVCPDPGLIRAMGRTLGAAGIHTDVTEKVTLDRHSGIRCVLLALRAATDPWNSEVLCDYLHSLIFPASDEAVDRLENYVRLWNIRGSQWERPFTRHPDGLKNEWEPDAEARLAALERTRRSVMAPLTALRDGIKNATDVRTMVASLYEYLQKAGLKACLQAQSDLLFGQGRLREAQQFVQVYELLLGAMEQMTLIMGDCVRTPDGFYRTVQMLLEQYGIGTVPATKNSIAVGGLGLVRCAELRHLLILGAENGVFPSVLQGGGVFTETERKTLLDRGMCLAPLRTEVVDRELSAIRQTFFAATQSVLVAARDGAASYLFHQAAAMFPAKKEASCTVILNEGEYAAARLRNGETPQTPEMKALAEKAGYDFGSLSPESVDGLYGKRYHFSASQVERLAGCRFAYFLERGLKLKADKPVAFDAAQFGTFVHSVLENTAKQVMAEGGFPQSTPERVRQLAEENAESYAAQLQNLAEDNCKWDCTIARHTEEALAVVADVAAELRGSRFVPARFEFSFGGKTDSEMDAIRIKGQTAECELTGYVDRLDLWEENGKTFVRVVDYKSGGKDIKFEDIAEGAGMQMLIYLFALEQNGEAVFGKKLRPAGVLYLPAMDPVVYLSELPAPDALDAEAEKERIKKKHRKGILLMDPAVISAMEDFPDKPQYLPITIAKDGAWTGNLMDTGSFERLRDFVFRKLGELADELKSGVVTPNPLIHTETEGACQWCDFKDLCHADFVRHETRRRKKITQKDFLDKLSETEAKAQ